MKKLIFLILATILSNVSIAQFTAIPDANFEQALIDLGLDNIIDGKVLTANIDTITSLNVSWKNINNLVGIDDFVSITNLDCSFNFIESLSLYNCKQITKLQCNNNSNLTFLNVLNCPKLTYLNCYESKLTSLDLAINSELSYLNCARNNLTSIDLSNNSQLTYLECSLTNIQSLDLSNNSQLTYLACILNNLSELDLTNCSQITTLYCAKNKITSLDLSNNSELVEFDCSNNNLTSLNLSNCKKLSRMYCNDNNIDSLDFSDIPQFTSLTCSNNNLELLKFAIDAQISEIEFSGTNLTTLDLSNCSKLTYLDCPQNKLKSLDITKCSNFSYFDCSSNDLSYLKLSKSNMYSFVGCHDNPNLFCIYVDDPIYFYDNWKYSISPWMQFSDIPCGTNQITGNIFKDYNVNCKKDTLENYTKQTLVKATANNTFYTMSDVLGNYKLYVDSNQTYKITLEVDSIIKNICNVNGSEINSGSAGKITQNIDFGLELEYTLIPDTNFEKALIELNYDDVIDGWVLTANIKDITNLYLNNKNISNLTGIEDFKQLKVFSCTSNYLTTVDMSKNVHLTELSFRYNNLTTINIKNCSQLWEFDCGYNKLTNIDVTNNPLLGDFFCPGNNLTSLDISNNHELFEFTCSYNKIKSLIFPNSSKLYLINCSNNNLSYLNVRNVEILEYLDSRNNPSLDCIIVKDPFYAYKKYDSGNYIKDLWSQYTATPCGTNQISGNIFNDKNNNCVKESTENYTDKTIVKAKGNKDFFVLSDDLGNYKVLVDSNQTYTITVYPENSNLVENICSVNGQNINSGLGGTKTENIDLGIQFKDCSILSVEITKERMRRCFENNTYITYKNEGKIDETNAEIFVDFPEYVDIVSASESYTLVDASKKIYKFEIDNIPAFSSGTINVVDKVICGDESIRGYTQCIKSWITPKSYCAETKDTTAWDKSSIKINQNPECYGDSIARFTITNEGSGNMSSRREYRLYYNNALAYTGTFQLFSGGKLTLNTSADGSTIRLEANQHPQHPGNSFPRATFEGCGDNGTPDKISFGYWINITDDDLDFDVSEVCLQIVDSYDPNDKKVSPSGITENNYVPEKQNLEYKIRFQNTGSDVAYKIVVIDTLSNQLDPSTIKIIGASHDYKFDIRGGDKTFLTFTFDNINLPDSTTNEAKSHGFISFSISPIDSIIPYTEIKNFADIYFDFNSAIRTDTAMVTALDTVILSDKIITVKENAKIEIINNNCCLEVPSAFSPNGDANNDILYAVGKNIENINFKIFNRWGKEVFNSTDLTLGWNGEYKGEKLETGVYLYYISAKSKDKGQIIERKGNITLVR